MLSEVGERVPGGNVTSAITELVVAAGILVGAVQAFLVKRQVKPNGGKSLADVVNRLEATLDNHVKTTDERLDRIETVLMGGNRPAVRHPSTRFTYPYPPYPTSPPGPRPPGSHLRVVTDLSNRSDSLQTPSPTSPTQEGQQ